MRRKIFINLTNGIEALEKNKLLLDEVSFIRIQSSHCESHQFEKILNEIDHNFLMSLALGYECIVYDYGAQSDIPKAIYMGLSWIDYVLNLRWFDIEKTTRAKGNMMNELFSKHYHKLQKSSLNKIDYYKRFLQSDKVIITAVADSTIMDNKWDFYTEIIENSLKK